MENFEYYNPTRLIFGKNTIANLSKYLPKDKKILVTYGGGSLFKNGVMDQVKDALKGYDYVEFGGIEANPEYDTLMKAVEIVRHENIDFLLAVGGGSVLDGTKFIAAACKFKGDAWDILTHFGQNITEALPLASVLTLPATGSEANANSVISRRSLGKKSPFASDYVRPVFSILDPETTYSLPLKQTVNGIIDTYVHILEQYMISRENTPIQDGMAENLLRLLHEYTPKLLDNPNDYNLRFQMMYISTLALNGQLGAGVTQDWATHPMGHELTAKFGIDHGASLSMVLPSLLRVRMDIKEAKLKQYAKNVLGMENANGEDAVKAMEAFFASVNSPTSLPQEVTEADIDDLVKRLFLQNPQNLGEDKKIDAQLAKEIYLKACS